MLENSEKFINRGPNKEQRVQNFPKNGNEGAPIIWHLRVNKYKRSKWQFMNFKIQ